MKILMPLLILLFILIFSCEKDKSIIESGPPGSFTYQSFDTLGNMLVTGWFTFQFVDSVHIEGSWHLEKFSNQNNIGPQIGDGKLKGGTYDSSIWMELNPQFRDNNMHLEGTIYDNRIEGTWAWLTFVGTSNWGTFKANKN
jgi:hypothetical protein